MALHPIITCTFILLFFGSITAKSWKPNVHELADGLSGNNNDLSLQTVLGSLADKNKSIKTRAINGIPSILSSRTMIFEAPKDTFCEIITRAQSIIIEVYVHGLLRVTTLVYYCIFASNCAYGYEKTQELDHVVKEFNKAFKKWSKSMCKDV